MTAPDATLTGRLREALTEHTSVRGFDEIGQWFSHACACSWHGQSEADHRAHVADVAAQTAAAWLGDAPLLLAEESFRHSWDMSDERRIDGAWVAGLCCECGAFVPYGQEVAHVAAALAALVAAIGGAE